MVTLYSCVTLYPQMMSKIASLEARGEEQTRKKEELLGELNKSQRKISELELREKDLQAWLPDGYSRIFRIVCVWPFGLLDYGSATLRCKI